MMVFQSAFKNPGKDSTSPPPGLSKPGCLMTPRAPGGAILCKTRPTASKCPHRSRIPRPILRRPIPVSARCQITPRRACRCSCPKARTPPLLTHRRSRRTLEPSRWAGIIGRGRVIASAPTAAEPVGACAWPTLLWGLWILTGLPGAVDDPAQEREEDDEEQDAPEATV
jgi:hypothetical protein